jgi:hypothetical protein
VEQQHTTQEVVAVALTELLRVLREALVEAVLAVQMRSMVCRTEQQIPAGAVEVFEIPPAISVGLVVQE